MITQPDPAVAKAARRHSHVMRLAIEALVFLRGEIRASELWLVAIATLVGAAAGLATIAIGMAAHDAADAVLQHRLRRAAHRR